MRILGVCILLALHALPLCAEQAEERERRERVKREGALPNRVLNLCRGRMKYLAVGAGVGTLGAGAVAVYPAFRDWVVTWERSLGAGIVYRFDRMLESVPYEDQKRLMEIRRRLREEEPVSDEEREWVVRFWSYQLTGDYDHNLAQSVTDPWTGTTLDVGQVEDFRRLDASRLLKSHPRACAHRGVCRHKAVVLAEVLGDFSIPCYAEAGVSESGGHAWVRLSGWKEGEDWVADPTNYTLVKRDAYLAETGYRGAEPYRLGHEFVYSPKQGVIRQLNLEIHHYGTPNETYQWRLQQFGN